MDNMVELFHVWGQGFIALPFRIPGLGKNFQHLPPSESSPSPGVCAGAQRMGIYVFKPEKLSI